MFLQWYVRHIWGQIQLKYLMIKLLILNAFNKSFEMLRRGLMTGMIILYILHPNKPYMFTRWDEQMYQYICTIHLWLSVLYIHYSGSTRCTALLLIVRSMALLRLRQHSLTSSSTSSDQLFLSLTLLIHPVILRCVMPLVQLLFLVSWPIHQRCLHLIARGNSIKPSLSQRVLRLQLLSGFILHNHHNIDSCFSSAEADPSSLASNC